SRQASANGPDRRPASRRVAGFPGVAAGPARFECRTFRARPPFTGRSVSSCAPSLLLFVQSERLERVWRMLVLHGEEHSLLQKCLPASDSDLLPNGLPSVHDSER